MISVIVPVYNTVDQLHKCIDSILGQTYTEIELILVDDGSTDGSEKVVDEYAKKDNRVIICHQKNQGESAARNKGLEFATGDIITFVDCDDWIEENMYELLIDEMQHYDLDIVACGWVKEYCNKQIPISNKAVVPAGVLDRNQLLRCIYMRDSYQGFAFMWDKIYRRRVLTDRNGELFKFDVDLKLGGDVLYLAMAAVKSRRARYVDSSLYHYYQREDSGMHDLSIRKMRDWISAYTKVLQLFDDCNIPSEIVGYVRRFMAYHASNAVGIALKENDVEAKAFFQHIMIENKEEYIDLNRDFPDRINRYCDLINI